MNEGRFPNVGKCNDIQYRSKVSYQSRRVAFQARRELRSARIIEA